MPGFFFSDVKVRQALTYATNREAMVGQVMQGLSTPAYSIWAPGTPQYVPTIAKQYKFNLAKAKALMKQTSVQPGTTVNMLVNTDEGDVFSFEEISSWLRRAGFENARTFAAPGPSPLILANKPHS